jgi:hypothetical protein
MGDDVTQVLAIRDADHWPLGDVVGCVAYSKRVRDWAVSTDEVPRVLPDGRRVWIDLIVRKTGNAHRVVRKALEVPEIPDDECRLPTANERFRFDMDRLQDSRNTVFLAEREPEFEPFRRCFPIPQFPISAGGITGKRCYSVARRLADQILDVAIETGLAKLLVELPPEVPSPSHVQLGEGTQIETVLQSAECRKFRERIAALPPLNDPEHLQLQIDLEFEHAELRFATNDPPPRECEPETSDCYVTLQQCAAIVGKSKATLKQRYVNGDLPAPAIHGGKGRAHEWNWSAIRPYLEHLFARMLPEHFPGDRVIKR